MRSLLDLAPVKGKREGGGKEGQGDDEGGSPAGRLAKSSTGPRTCVRNQCNRGATLLLKLRA